MVSKVTSLPRGQLKIYLKILKFDLKFEKFHTLYTNYLTRKQLNTESFYPPTLKIYIVPNVLKQAKTSMKEVEKRKLLCINCDQSMLARASWVVE